MTKTDSGFPKLRLMLSAILFLIFLCVNIGYSSDRVVIYLFRVTGCSHCEREIAFLEKLKTKYPGLEIKNYEVRKNPENARLFVKMAKSANLRISTTPATFIGEFEPIIGYESDETTGKIIEERIRTCIKKGCRNPGDKVLYDIGNYVLAKGDAGFPASPPVSTSLPSTGGLDTNNISSLPLFTVVIAGLDAFNPCAFFVLFTLLGMLLHEHSKKRMLVIGGIFVFFSGFIYFLFMSAWLNVFMFVGEINAITVAAGIIAILIGLINIKSFFFLKKWVSLVIPDSVKPDLYRRMRKLMHASSFISLIVGSVILAIASNSYELLCTAGFPMVFTRVLTLRHLEPFQYYLYLVLYNLVYIIPLATIVIIFSVTLGSRKMTEWEGRILKLVSGLMMFALGIILLANPEMLNNLFATSGILAAVIAISGIIIYLTKILSCTEKEAKKQ